jgi:glycosyltransferase involved in cell wall biosynthesis
MSFNSGNTITISIIMTTYNGELYIREQLESLLDQTYTNFELYITDDNSTDNTYNILKEYQEKYPFIYITQNKTQLGFVRNFEQLLQKCNSKYISFCDQDDVWHKDKLKISIESLENEDNSIPLLFHSDLYVTNDKLEILYNSFFRMRHYQFKPYKQLDAMLGRCGVMGNTTVINQKLQSLLLPFPTHLASHDYWIALIAELFGKRVSYLEPLVYYRIHQNNFSNSITSLNKKRKIVSIINKEYRLPFQDISREKVLRELLQRYPIHNQDKRVIIFFLQYLHNELELSSLISLLFQYNFFKKNNIYKIKTFIAILWKKA